MGLYYDLDTPVAFGSRQGVLIALQVFFLSISLIIYVLRLYTRAHILRSIGNDDYIMGLAVVCGIFHSSCIIFDRLKNPTLTFGPLSGLERHSSN
jgi:hypothetical protein